MEVRFLGTTVFPYLPTSETESSDYYKLKHGKQVDAKDAHDQRYFENLRSQLLFIDIIIVQLAVVLLPKRITSL